MKKTLFLLVIIFSFQIGISQTHIRRDNYFAPFHEKIKDTTKRTLTTNGHYFHAGLGTAFNFYGSALGGNFGYTLISRNHVFSISGCEGATTGEPRYNKEEYNTFYLGALYGQAIRGKNYLVSLSTGIAYSDFYHRYATHSSSEDDRSVNWKGACIPLEFKAFVMANNIIGIGVCFSETLTIKNTVSYFQISAVFGHWNYWRKRRIQ